MKTNTRDYGWNGRLGLGTPQGNPTVEAEMRRLIPIGVEYFTVRLGSGSSEPKQRLIDYFAFLPESVKRYAKLELDGFICACTGSSYLLGDARARHYADMASEIIKAPVILAADAIADWLKAGHAASIVLLSPYPDWLNKPAIDYWQGHGFEVCGIAQVDIGSEDTYGIYEQQSSDAVGYAERLLDTEADAFVISGTGMPSLPLIKKLRADGRTVISSNLALAQAGLALLGMEPAEPHTWVFNGTT